MKTSGISGDPHFHRPQWPNLCGHGLCAQRSPHHTQSDAQRGTDADIEYQSATSPVHNAFLTQICITPSALSEPQLTSVFHGIDRVVHRVADPDKESSTLMAQVEEAELKQQQDFIKKARKKSIPRCTVAIMAICTIFLVLEYLLAYLDGNMESAIVAVGGYYKMSIVAAHEYWRILSGGFVHNGVVHFVISLYALYATGKLCEQRLGRGWYMAVFFPL